MTDWGKSMFMWRTLRIINRTAVASCELVPKIAQKVGAIQRKSLPLHQIVK